MQSQAREIVDLEKKFWQSIVDEDTDTAVGMLADQSLMVSSHGAMKFDHAGYRKMAEQGSMVLNSFELKDIEVVHPNDTTAIQDMAAAYSNMLESGRWPARFQPRIPRIPACWLSRTTTS